MYMKFSTPILASGFILFVMALFTSETYAGAQNTQASKPNIIFFLADDLPLQSFKVYGNSNSFHTPAIDRLADQGVAFTHGFSHSWCTPSRGALLSGKFLTRKIHDVPTFGTILQSAGYTTGIAGKWMVQNMELSPHKKGFDEALLQMNYYAYWLPDIVTWNSQGYLREINQPINQSLKSEWSVEPGEGPGKATRMEGEYAPDVINKFALDFIERNAQQPFFLYYPFKLPHYPFMPTPDTENLKDKEADKFIEEYRTKPLGVYISSHLEAYKEVSGRDYNLGSQEYLVDMVEYMDKLIGNVVDKLESEGIRENTLIVFASDNGCRMPFQLDPGEKWLPGAKGKEGEMAIRVPLIVSWPGVTKPGTRCDDLVSFVDFLQTFAEVGGAQLPPDEPFDGVSFLPLIKGEPGNPAKKWFYKEGKRGGMLRSQRYKLYSDGRFFDMEKDIEEKNPIPKDTNDLQAAAARKELEAAFADLAAKGL